MKSQIWLLWLQDYAVSVHGTSFFLSTLIKKKSSPPYDNDCLDNEKYQCWVGRNVSSDWWRRKIVKLCQNVEYEDERWLPTHRITAALAVLRQLWSNLWNATYKHAANGLLSSWWWVRTGPQTFTALITFLLRLARAVMVSDVRPSTFQSRCQFQSCMNLSCLG